MQVAEMPIAPQLVPSFGTSSEISKNGSSVTETFWQFQQSTDEKTCPRKLSQIAFSQSPAGVPGLNGGASPTFAAFFSAAVLSSDSIPNIDLKNSCASCCWPTLYQGHFEVTLLMRGF